MLDEHALIRKMMLALAQDYAAQQSIWELRIPENSVLTIKPDNHPYGWYRKFDKPSKRK
jgi:hypothetical protein